MARRLGFAGVSAVAVLIAVSLAAWPCLAFADNSGCLMCHETSLRFSVPAVDRDTACGACHTPGMAGTHPFHQAGSNCGAYCHPGWGDSLLSAVPYYSDPVSGATFAAAGSKHTSASVIHVIHSKPRWPAQIDTEDSRCASCHATAGCDACHLAQPSASHATHSSSMQAPRTDIVGHGVVGADQTVYSVEQETEYCGTSGCHSLASTRDNRPMTCESFTHPANPASGIPENAVAYAPTASVWKTSYRASYTMGRMSYSNYANASLAITFTGEKVTMVADKDPYRGICDIWIDGTFAATVDLYAPTTMYQVVVYESPVLLLGAHTIEVRVTGARNPSARYNFVTVDCFQVYACLPSSIAPECAENCHTDKLADHANFDHEATQTAGFYPAGRFECTDCHSLGMWAEHGRTTSKTAADSCSACHPVYADYSLDEFSNSVRTGYGSCTWDGDGSVTGCHQVANAEQPHNFIDSNHDASGVGATVDCRACHGNDLSAIHDDTSTGRGQHSSLVSNGWATDCLTCHGTDRFPVTKDCTNSGCHTGSGVVDMVSHPAPPHNGTNSNTGVPRTGGELCSTCHSLELTSEHGKATSLTNPGAAAIGCADCHGAAYFPAGWITPPNNTCQACHVVGSGAPGAATAGEPHESAEYTAKHDWSATEGGCDGALCHDVDMIDLIHTDPFNATVSDPRGSSCRSCHTTPNAVPTVTTCADCHTPHDTTTPHDPNATPALTAANADCLTCHTKFDQAAGLIYHGGMCYTCHNHLPTNDLTHYLQDNYGARCTDCHNSTVLGTYDYQPYDTNHYDQVPHTSSTQGASAYVLNGETNACQNCHSMELGIEHTLASSVLAGTGTICERCHTEVTAAAVVANDWSSDTCDACHGAGAISARHAGVSNHSITSAGCSSTGAGCHNTNDLAMVGADKNTRIHNTCLRCHDKTASSPNLAFDPTKQTCGSGRSCHQVAGQYDASSYVHNGGGGLANGVDATHHTADASMNQVIGAYSNDNACSDCHSAALSTAHATAGWTAPSCRTCHNATTPVAAAPVVKSNWTTRDCVECHSTSATYHNSYTSVTHSSTAASGCTIGACHGAVGGVVDVRTLHDKVTAGCTVSGTDTNGWTGGCHALDTQMSTDAMSCGTGATGLACHTDHTHTNHGGSSGGQMCNVCHTALNGMVDDTSTYHHVLDSATPFRAPNGGAYPTSTSALECVSCHLDHSEYHALPGGSGKAYSLRNSATVANPTATNTDDTLCLSCHVDNIARNTSGQKANAIIESMVWDVNSTWWLASPHNYDAPGPFNDGSVFYANCAKCHGELQGTLSSGKFSVHMSAEQRLLNALGDTTVYTVNEEQMCFRCHSLAADFAANGGTMPGTPKPSSNVDWYGTQPMSNANVAIYQQMNSAANTKGHKPTSYSERHLLDEADENQAYISANKHVECADCHNHHAVGDSRHEWGTTNAVSEALRGVTGEAFNSAALSTVNVPTTAQVNAQINWKTNADYEYEICLKCHSSANTSLATWGGNKTGATTQNRWTNVAADFNVGNQSRHPVFTSLPATDPSTSYGTSRVYPGQLIDIWAPGDTMYCSDCHGDSTAPLYSDPDALNHAQGPHGSAVEYSLRGPNTDWPINSRTGQLFTLDNVYGGDKPFCMNCHPSVGANKVHARNPTHKSSACVNCHILIPHGGGISRLLGDGDGAMPARYAYNNDKSTMWMASFIKRTDPNTYTRGDCRVTTAGTSACGGGHSTGSLTTGSYENW